MPSVSPDPAATPPRFDPKLIGIACGLASSVFYTLATIFLRQVAETRDPIWVSCVKAVPVTLVAWTLIWRRYRHGLPALPAPRTIGMLVATGLIVQLAGNVANQWSLGQIGLALVVPLTLGTLITGGVLLARIWLLEPIVPRSAFALLVLIVAIVVLSLGAGEAGIPKASVDGAAPHVVLGVLAACISGVAYAMSHVVIRRTVTGVTPVAASLGIISLTGLVSLSLISAGFVGFDEIRATTRADLLAMLLAGVFNALGFFTLGVCLQRLSVVYVNAFNASQTAMAAVAGVVIFGEALTLPLLGGVALTAIGLLLMRGHERKAAPTSAVEPAPLADPLPEAQRG